MRCPIDEATLVMSERGGIEIDYCPQCRGVWLDRGELDKIIDRAVTEAPGAAPAGAPPQYDSYRPAPQHPARSGYSQQPYGYGKKRKKEHWLMELFG